MILSLLFLLLTPKLSLTADYCKLNCGGNLNSACKNILFCETGKGDCTLLRSDEFREQMLENHNRLRNKIASGQEKGFPTAAGMYELVYDAGLEHTCECHLARCRCEHDSCRKTKKWDHVGQNMYCGKQSYEVAEMVIRSVEQWYGENKFITPQDGIIDKFQKKAAASIVHFTAIIWAATTHLGCGWSHNSTRQHLACNYGRKGNIVGLPVYEKGAPCSKCKDGCSTKWPALCKNLESNSEATTERTTKRPKETTENDDEEDVNVSVYKVVTVAARRVNLTREEQRSISSSGTKPPESRKMFIIILMLLKAVV